MPRIRDLVTASLLCAIGFATAQAATLGEARVLSQQGQRLKVAVPVQTAAGERMPVMRFSVASATLSNGNKLSAEHFTVSGAERGNTVYLQSREVVNAAKVKLVLDVANEPAARGQFDLSVPAVAYAQGGDTTHASGFGRGEQAKARGNAARAPKARVAKPRADWAPKKAKCSC